MYFKDLKKLENGLKTIQKDENIKSILLFGCDKNTANTVELEEVLRLNTKPLLGGIFPHIIAGGELKEIGFLIIPLFEELEVKFFEIQKNISIETQLDTEMTSASREAESVFCFYDAFWEEKTSFLEALYDELGPVVNYLGGGAGSLSFQSLPCVIANQNIYENAAVIGLTKSPILISTGHGWQSISEPIKVTETDGRTIVSLNWKPAFEVYKSIVEASSNKIFTHDNFFEIAKSHPLGLVKLDDEMIVRDLYDNKNNKLYLIDDVNVGEYVKIMHGSLPSLLEEAKQTLEKYNYLNNQDYTTFYINCVSRVLFLEDDFQQELNLLNKNQQANGILSFGEIANSGDSFLEVLNKTIVVAKWQ
jgi:hypothetical protein